MSLRYIGINIILIGSPMKHFTPETFQPREQTLDLIRQFAYTYRVKNKNNQALSLN